MKTLSDGKNVSAKSYYFLLEWNEQNKKQYIQETFNKNRLCDLELSQYIILWDFATKDEQVKLCKGL